MYPKILKLNTFKDKRGVFCEIFNQNKYKNLITKIRDLGSNLINGRQVTKLPTNDILPFVSIL